MTQETSRRPLSPNTPIPHIPVRYLTTHSRHDWNCLARHDPDCDARSYTQPPGNARDGPPRGHMPGDAGFPSDRAGGMGTQTASPGREHGEDSYRAAARLGRYRNAAAHTAGHLCRPPSETGPGGEQRRNVRLYCTDSRSLPCRAGRRSMDRRCERYNVRRVGGACSWTRLHGPSENSRFQSGAGPLPFADRRQYYRHAAADGRTVTKVTVLD